MVKPEYGTPGAEGRRPRRIANANRAASAPPRGSGTGKGLGIAARPAEEKPSIVRVGAASKAVGSDAEAATATDAASKLSKYRRVPASR